MSPERTLRPLPFHVALKDALRELEPGLFRWFASDELREKYADEVRLELLRSTYRLPREGHETSYALAEEICEAFGIEAPLTLYQSQESGSMNAALVFVPSAVHIVLQGPIAERLTPPELRALFGHELAHHKLGTEEDGAYRTTGAVIDDAAHGGGPSHVQSARRFRLWTELYADRGALLACNDLSAAIACLVKVETGLAKVDGAAYLAQAKEALGAGGTKSEGRTHPETFVRAFALSAWAEDRPFAEVEALVEGPTEIEALDLVQQRTLTLTTERLLHTILDREELRTEPMLVHARRFFPDFSPRTPDDALDLASAGDSVAEYAAYVLLDFALVDHDLEDRALARVAALAGPLGVRNAFRTIAKKELKLTLGALDELEAKGRS